MNVVKDNLYNDRWIRILVVPIFTALGYYVTYNFIRLNSEFVLLFISDLIKGYVVWELLRYCVIRLDRHTSWEDTPVKRLALQLTVPVFVPLLVFIVLVELEYMFIRTFPNENFYSLDVIVVLIFNLSGSLMYTALYFFRKYEEARKFQEDLAKKAIKEGVTVKLGTKEIKIDFSQILAFYSEGKQTWILTREVKRFPADLSLDKLEEIVPDNFFRVNRKHLLIPETIQAISADTYGKVKAEMKDSLILEPVIIISRDKAAAFKQWFRKFAPAA